MAKLENVSNKVSKPSHGVNYLITGGAGFIGSNFIHYIFGKYPEAEIINLDKLTYAGNLENLRDFEKNPKYKFVQGDIADPAVVNELVPQADVIVNFAAETHVDRSITGPADFVRTNVVGTQVLLDAAGKFQKRFRGGKKLKWPPKTALSIQPLAWTAERWCCRIPRR